MLARWLFTDLTVLLWSQIRSVSKDLCNKRFKSLPFSLLLGLKRERDRALREVSYPHEEIDHIKDTYFSELFWEQKVSVVSEGEKNCKVFYMTSILGLARLWKEKLFFFFFFHVCIRTKNTQLSEHLFFEQRCFLCLYLAKQTDTKSLMR